MQKWIVFALLSALFAGFTSVLAKVGLKEINPTLALGIRTAFIFLFVMLTVIFVGAFHDFKYLSGKSFIYLILSAITTTASWLFYYHAMKEGKVSIVTTIDKCGIIITLILAFVILNEQITGKLILDIVLILSGLFLLI
jgi:transporter family protein